jgi:ABC-2 type transport system ATP-binding protein
MTRPTSATAASSTSERSAAVTDDVISVRGLEMAYGSFPAVRGIDLRVRRGEILAFLGPNGAGKTTTVEILEGFRRRTAGDVRVLGEDPGAAGPAWRARIGVVLQESQPEPELSVRECVALYAGYYPRPRPIDDVLELVGLTEKATARSGRLSGGQRRRLDVALALIGDPELVFLDEPTTGFDPAARRQSWEVVAGLRDLGKTVFITTHYMDEAEYLADRIVVVAAGRVVAEGTPANLGGRNTMPSSITFSLPTGTAVHDLPTGLSGRATPTRSGRVELSSTAPLDDVERLAGWARSRGIDLPDLQLVRPSLEDVYLGLVADAKR